LETAVSLRDWKKNSWLVEHKSSPEENHRNFLESVKAAFPSVDWDKAYEEFKAVGESKRAK
jgi:hypothetical protein